MFHSISWADYFITILVLLAAYYTAVISIYFRKEAAGLFSVRNGKALFTTTGFHNISEKWTKKEETEHYFQIAAQLQEELHDLIGTAAVKKYPEEELLTGMQLTLRKYMLLAGTPFQVSINHYIQQSCSEKLSMTLQEDVLNRVWQG
jgi:hypothetical protein